MDSTIEKNIIRDLKQTAKALGIPEGAAEDFINAAIPDIKKSLKNKSIITKQAEKLGVFSKARVATIYNGKVKISSGMPARNPSKIASLRFLILLLLIFSAMLRGINNAVPLPLR